MAVAFDDFGDEAFTKESILDSSFFFLSDFGGDLSAFGELGFLFSCCLLLTGIFI